MKDLKDLIKSKHKKNNNAQKLITPLEKFRSNIQKYIEITSMNKKLLEALHTNRTASSIFPNIEIKNTRKSIIMQNIEIIAIKSVDKFNSNVPNSWMKKTFNQISKVRKKAKPSVDFFGTVNEEIILTPEERVAWLEQIYLSKDQSTKTESNLYFYCEF